MKNWKLKFKNAVDGSIKKTTKYLRIDLTKLHMNENETVITSM